MNLRQRIFRATSEGDLRKVRSLQKLMLRSYSNRLGTCRDNEFRQADVARKSENRIADRPLARPLGVVRLAVATAERPPAGAAPPGVTPPSSLRRGGTA